MGRTEELVRMWRFRLWAIRMMPLWRYRCGYWGWDAVKAAWSVRPDSPGEAT